MQETALTGKNLKLVLDFGRQAVAKDKVRNSGEVDTSPSFHSLLTAAIDMAPFSREVLASKIGRTGGVVSQWINKGVMPDLAVVFKIEDVLDLPLGALVKHHSPDVWAIIEAKTTSRQEPRSYIQLIQAGLMIGPYTARDRRSVLEISESLANLNLVKKGPDSGR